MAGSGKGSQRPGKGNGSKSGSNRNLQSAAAQRAIRGARGGTSTLNRLIWPVLAVVVVVAVVVVGIVVTRGHDAAAATNADPTQADPNSKVLASTAHEATGAPVDGIQSNSMEQILFHVHAHLAMYVNGSRKVLPYGVGIVGPYQLQQTPDGPFVAGGRAFYWLHTHDESGVVHIESPVRAAFTLGQFFDIWNQPLTATQLGPDQGAVTAFVNGKVFTGDPRTIPLNAHNVIQLDVGKVVPFQSYTFPQGV